jgi:Flp pilus assembly protein TadG
VRRLRDQRGAAAVELAMFVPLLVMMFTGAAFVVRLVLGYHALTDLSETGARYATRAQLDPDTGEYRFRPTATEVTAYIQSVADEKGLDLQAVSVSPDPSTAYPGTPVTISVTAVIDRGVIGRAAREMGEAFPGMFGDADFSPETCGEELLCLSTTVTMREE